MTCMLYCLALVGAFVVIYAITLFAWAKAAVDVTTERSTAEDVTCAQCGGKAENYMTGWRCERCGDLR